MFLPQYGARGTLEELQRTEYELQVLERMAPLAAALVTSAEVNDESDAATSVLEQLETPRTVADVVDALDSSLVPLRFRRVRPTAPTVPLRGAALRAALESVTRPLAEELLARSQRTPEGGSTYQTIEQELRNQRTLCAGDPELINALEAGLSSLDGGAFGGPVDHEARDLEAQWNQAIDDGSSPHFGGARIDTVDDRFARETVVAGEKVAAVESLRRLFGEVPPNPDDAEAVQKALNLLDRVAQTQRQRSRRESDELLAQVTRQVFDALSVHVQGESPRAPLVTTGRILTACALEVAGLDDAPDIDTDPDATRDRRVARRLHPKSGE